MYSLFKAVKENDGTYTVYASQEGCSYVLYESGIRGCNIKRKLDKLYDAAYAFKLAMETSNHSRK